jgi:hypothetical protein
LPPRWRTRTWGSFAAISSANLPVPSGELSSTIMIVAAGTAVRTAWTIEGRTSSSL